MRGEFGVSVNDVGGDVTFGEAFSLITVAFRDTSTYLGAAVQNWEYRASMADVVQIAAAAGDRADEVLPWGARERIEQLEARKVTEADIEAGKARLSQVSAFRHLPEFDE